ncbi:site-specific recombinase XerD [Amycolatopsis echigonensis]|uniref:Site-specific recombinase XerD n=1 Tax=Amycolatopsis echigonensis TaxID=2576905 RepID=A0A2N3WJ76_9PSEU|nr:site-specific integrase [Amycolatopsis niigatensis]PKV93925.1 site-specific recombinase XerD [Amycolatopsis niigatensis]
MARPSLPLGTWGKIRTHDLPNGKCRAVANYKDYDGVTRPVERVGDSKAKATSNLLEALRDRKRRNGDGEIKPETKVCVAAAMWLKEVDESSKAARTKREYRDTWNRYLVNAVGERRVGDVLVSTANRVITEIRDRHGRGAASHAKVVLSGIFALVVRHDAIDKNPVREIESLGAKKRKKERMVNARTIGRVLGVFHASKAAKRWDLVDMVDVLSGLGCRIGELLALDWETSIDFDKGTVRFHGTVIRVTGQGLFVQDHTKSRAGMRTVRPPAWVMLILKARHAASESKWVFPSGAGTLRDPDNTRAQIRRVVAETPFKGLHPHDFRHYVAAVLDAAGLTAREIADYLGHERISTTQEDYMERGVVGEDAGPALGERPDIEPPKEEG